MNSETELRHAMVRFAKSLFDRGFTVGSSGNISAACEGGLLITPTNSCFGFLDPERISKVGPDGDHLSGDKPSKEIFLHQAFYETRPQTRAVVHLHSTSATAISCLEDTDPDDCIPPITPYVVMRVGKVKLLPYIRPGDPGMGEMIRQLGGRHACVLLANHGPVVAAESLESAVYAAEELEETARLVMLMRGEKIRRLSQENVTELMRVFNKG